MLEVSTISSALAGATVIENHYLHRKPPIRWSFGLFDNKILQGVCTFGTPASRHLQVGALPSQPDCVIELNRLWVDDGQPRNTESWFVSRCLKGLPGGLVVVSYADLAQGHAGYVYRALNFRYAGWTDMDRKTPRFDYVPVNGGHTRNAFRTNGGGVAAKVRRSPKVRYWTLTGSRTQQRNLLPLVRWPSMDWNSTPPPVE